jgi:hypothetical protein
MTAPAVLTRPLKLRSKAPEVILQNAVNGWETQFVLCRQRLERRTREEGTRSLMWIEESSTPWRCPGPPLHAPPPGREPPLRESRKSHRSLVSTLPPGRKRRFTLDGRTVDPPRRGDPTSSSSLRSQNGTAPADPRITRHVKAPHSVGVGNQPETQPWKCGRPGAEPDEDNHGSASTFPLGFLDMHIQFLRVRVFNFSEPGRSPPIRTR